jgi:myosin heavy subunit
VEGCALASSLAAGVRRRMQAQVTALEEKLHVQEQRLQEWREREAAEGGGRAPADLIADAKRKRDSARREVQRLQARLSTLMAERRDATKKLDRLARQKSINADVALPSVALRGGGDVAAVEEIRTLMRENKELEEAVAQHEGAKLHLDKLHNDRRDTLRRIKALRAEDAMVTAQLDVRRTELEELASAARPSAARQKHEEEVVRLRKEINANSAARTHAERDTTALQKRLLRVRGALGGWLKAEGLGKPQQPLPAADDATVGRLVEYVLALAEKVRALESAVGVREERAESLEASAESAASELRRVVAKRTAATQRTGASGLLTEGGDGTVVEADAPPSRRPAPKQPTRRPAKSQRPKPTVRSSAAAADATEVGVTDAAVAEGGEVSAVAAVGAAIPEPTEGGGDAGGDDGES